MSEGSRCIFYRDCQIGHKLVCKIRLVQCRVEYKLVCEIRLVQYTGSLQNIMRRKTENEETYNIIEVFV